MVDDWSRVYWCLPSPSDLARGRSIFMVATLRSGAAEPNWVNSTLLVHFNHLLAFDSLFVTEQNKMNERRKCGTLNWWFQLLTVPLYLPCTGHLLNNGVYLSSQSHHTAVLLVHPGCVVWGCVSEMLLRWAFAFLRTEQRIWLTYILSFSEASSTEIVFGEKAKRYIIWIQVSSTTPCYKYWVCATCTSVCIGLSVQTAAVTCPRNLVIRRVSFACLSVWSKFVFMKRRVVAISLL